MNKCEQTGCDGKETISPASSGASGPNSIEVPAEASKSKSATSGMLTTMLWASVLSSCAFADTLTTPKSAATKIFNC